MMAETANISDRVSNTVLTVGVVSDTHIPDRVSDLHPALLSGLKAAKVDRILHAGDISTASVLNALESVAPVTAVRGNRDWALLSSLPLIKRIELAGISVALLHGHGGFIEYWRIKISILTKGYAFSTFLPVLRRAAQNSRIVIFGHSHFPEIQWMDGVLYFNPGAVSVTNDQPRASYGLLRIDALGNITPEIIPLQGNVVRNREWKAI